VLCRGLEKNGMVRAWHGRGMGMAWHGKCESDTAAMCKSNGKDTFSTLSGTAWHGRGMGTECYVCIGLNCELTGIALASMLCSQKPES